MSRRKKPKLSKPVYLVYQTTNTLNNRKYIGVHMCVDFNDGYLGSGTALQLAIKKYGRGTFSREILFTFDNPEQAYLKEQELVTFEMVLGDEYYNLTTGGQLNPRNHSPQSKELLYGYRKGFDSENRKKSRIEIHKRKREAGDYTRITATNIATGESHFFASISDCAETLGLVHSCVSRVARGDQNRRQHKGWKFSTEKHGESLPAIPDSPNKYITAINTGGFSVTVKSQYLGYRKTLEEAIELRDSHINKDVD